MDNYDEIRVVLVEEVKKVFVEMIGVMTQSDANKKRMIWQYH